MRDALIDIFAEIASALFTRASAMSARRREARKRQEFEDQLAKLRQAAVEAERKILSLVRNEALQAGRAPQQTPTLTHDGVTLAK